MRPLRCCPFFACVLSLFSWLPVFSASTASLSADLAGYPQHVEPFLARYCMECHGPADTKGGIRVDEMSGNLLDGAHQTNWKALPRRDGSGAELALL